MPRMTKTSTENLKIADAAHIHLFQGGPRCLLSVSLRGNVSYITGAKDQDSILFNDPAAARLFLRRYRPDLVPTILDGP